MCIISEKDKYCIYNALQNFDFSEGFHYGMNKEMKRLLEEYSFFNNCIIKYGATKYVIILEDKNYVIKIPYNAYCPSSDYEEDDIEYYYGADSLEREWDYCETEMERYSIAKESKFKNCFSETSFLFFVNDYPVYIQDKCQDCDECYEGFSSKEEKEKIKNMITKGELNQKDFPLSWVTDFINCFGEIYFKDFLNFLEDLDWDDDLRRSNVGYLNNIPVLIDYSSFGG